MEHALELRRDEVGIVPVALLKSRIQAIQQVMKDLMIEGVHYGTIPGTQKPSLFKPGAELIAATFQLRISTEPVEERVNEEEVSYRVRATARASDGTELGAAEGLCTTNEKKYRWRYPTHIKEWEAAPEHRRRITFDSNGNEKKQVRQETGDVQHTILMMADKRATVALVRKVTACSDVFAQELEEDDDPQQKAAERVTEEVATPQRESAAAPAAAAAPVSSDGSRQLASVKKVKSGVNEKDEPWSLYVVKTKDGLEYKTFSPKVALQAEEFVRDGRRVIIQAEAGPTGRAPKIVSIEAAA